MKNICYTLGKRDMHTINRIEPSPFREANDRKPKKCHTDIPTRQSGRAPRPPCRTRSGILCGLHRLAEGGFLTCHELELQLQLARWLLWEYSK